MLNWEKATLHEINKRTAALFNLDHLVSFLVIKCVKGFRQMLNPFLGLAFNWVYITFDHALLIDE